MTSVPALGERHGRTLVVAHRGDRLAPENTRTAFRQARQAGADMIETDVQLSADGHLFLFHDDTGARTTNIAEVFPRRAHDPITSFTRDELDCLDVGSYFRAQFAGERIPSLADVVIATEFCTAINIEMKSPRRSPGVDQALAAALEGQGIWRTLITDEKVVVSSFDSQVLRDFHRLAPHIRVRQLGPIPEDDAALREAAVWVEGFVVDYATLRPEDVERLASAGLSVSVFTVNVPEDMAKMVEWGCESIVTDLPGVLSAVQQGTIPLPESNGVRIARVATVDQSGTHGGSSEREYVVLVNAGTRRVDVSGYRLQLQDAPVDRLIVGDGCSLDPGEELRIYTGTEEDKALFRHNGRPGNFPAAAGKSIVVLTPGLKLIDVYGY